MNQPLAGHPLRDGRERLGSAALRALAPRMGLAQANLTTMRPPRLYDRPMRPSLFFHVVGEEDSSRGFPRTVYNPVELVRIFPHLPSEDMRRALRGSYPEGRAQVWGVPPGALDHFRNLLPGDLVLLFESSADDSQGGAVARVVHAWPVELHGLSVELWGEPKLPYIFFFEGQRAALPWSAFGEVVGYAPNFRPPSFFSRVHPDRVEERGGAAGILASLGPELLGDGRMRRS